MSGLYIRKFLDRLQQLESKGSRDFVCSIQDAKLLHSDITRLLLDIETLQTKHNTSSEQIEVTVEGGNF